MGILPSGTLSSVTWVVGTGARFGSVLMAGDVRITLPGGREVDCLQKVFVLGSAVIGGFAGSVTVGLDVLNLLARQLATAPPGTGWDLAVITATWLPRVIRRRFSLHKEESRRLGAAFLVGAVSPGRKTQGLFAETKLFAFRSSNRFEPEEIPSGDVGSIGCGSVLEDSVRATFASQEFQLHWNAGPRMHSFLLAHQLRKRLLEQPAPGVSPRFMMAWAVPPVPQASMAGWGIEREADVEPWTTLGADEHGGRYVTDRDFKLVRTYEELKGLVGADAALAVG